MKMISKTYFSRYLRQHMALLLFIIPLSIISCTKPRVLEGPEPINEWTRIDTLAPGLIHYQMEGFHGPTHYRQIINVLKVDITNPDFDLSFNRIPRQPLSQFAPTIPGAVGAVNGTYGESMNGEPVSFVKTYGTVNTQATVAESDTRFWKHEGAIYYDPKTREIGIKYGSNADYLSWDYPNIVSGAPVLIDDYDPVGLGFADPDAPIATLPGEHPDHMQGVRHPRTAVAITEDKHVLLITVDGRRFESGGMNANELTRFLVAHFNPQYALNIDGGGSTTMWIEGSTASETGVVNYPTDNGQFDHGGERNLNNCIIITQK